MLFYLLALLALAPAAFPAGSGVVAAAAAVAAASGLWLAVALRKGLPLPGEVR